MQQKADCPIIRQGKEWGDPRVLFLAPFDLGEVTGLPALRLFTWEAGDNICLGTLTVAWVLENHFVQKDKSLGRGAQLEKGKYGPLLIVLSAI